MLVTSAGGFNSKKLFSLYSVKQYGAIGDGITDDTAAIDAAIDAVPDGGILYLPEGIYSLSLFTKTITKRMIIRGASRHGTILQGLTSMTFTSGLTIENLTIKDSTTPLIFSPGAGGIEGIYIDNVLFDTVTKATNIGVTTNLVSNVHVTNCEVKNSTWGFLFVGRVANIWVKDCYIHDLTASHVCGIRLGTNVYKSYPDAGAVFAINNKIENLEATGAGSVETQGIMLYGPEVYSIGNIVKEVTASGVGPSDCEGIYLRGDYIFSSGDHLYNAGNHGNGSLCCKVGDDNVVTIVEGASIYGTGILSAGLYISGHKIEVTNCDIHMTVSKGMAAYTWENEILLSNNNIRGFDEGVRLEAFSVAIVRGNFIRAEEISDSTGLALYFQEGLIGGLPYHCIDAIVTDNSFERGDAGDVIDVTSHLTGDLIIKDNRGYITRAHGAAVTIDDGGTIAHGLVAAPTWANVSPSVAGEMATVTTLDATNITVAIKKHDGSAGTQQTIYWEVEI